MNPKQNEAKKARDEADAATKDAEHLAAVKAEDQVLSAALADAKIADDAAVKAEAKADAEITGESGWFRVITGYNLHNPYQDVLFRAGEATEAKTDEWVLAQLDAGILVKSYKPE